MNYAGFQYGEPPEVIHALEHEEPDTAALALALANALRRVHALECLCAAMHNQMRPALQGVLDPFHQGQVRVRPEAAGYVQAAIDAGEEVLEGLKAEAKGK